MAAFTGWKSSKESILLRFVTGGADIKGGQVETLDEYFDADVPRPGTRHFTTHDISLLGTAEFSLPTLLSGLNASAVTSTTALQAQVTQLTAERDEWRAKYEQVAPPVTIPAKAINIALHKLELANAWGKAVELADQAKWWYDVGQINPLGTEWRAIVAEMDKAGMWGNSSEAALLALAEDIAGANILPAPPTKVEAVMSPPAASMAPVARAPMAAAAQTIRIVTPVAQAQEAPVPGVWSKVKGWVGL